MMVHRQFYLISKTYGILYSQYVYWHYTVCILYSMVYCMVYGIPILKFFWSFTPKVNLCNGGDKGSDTITGLCFYGGKRATFTYGLLDVPGGAESPEQTSTGHPNESSTPSGDSSSPK